MRAKIRAVRLAWLFALAPSSVAALDASQLGIVINRNDPMSVATGRYYQQRRGIPSDAVVQVDLPRTPTVSRAIAARALAAVNETLPGRIQALALAWTYPYRVGCMSITAAFAAGVDERFCATLCKPTLRSPYYDSPSGAPYRDHRWRPAMLLAGTEAHVRALIDRGVRADNAAPRGTGYLVSTGDRARNVRARTFPYVLKRWQSTFPMSIVSSESIEARHDVMFYITGTKSVQHLNTNRFLPGAIADHLTSFGGKLEAPISADQMSILRWLEAGATGSYGTVVEPCNFPQKFPNPEVLVRRYLGGDTLIEAYWKSVAWPGQGVFVGEPLARPFGRPS